MLNRMTDTLDFHGKALGLRSERQRLLASNIANADTPGYVSRELDFKNALREATGRQQGPAGLRVATGSAGGQAAAGRLATTAPGHLGSGSIRGGSMLDDDRLLYSTAAQSSLDGNTVDMNRERASFADNAVKYEATLRFINGNVRTMLDAIKGQS